ncbi:hypothetical protein RHGRI_019336 [Rhododendron griersonianum]|uniref:Uncharacterized protein n=1 Tax=Rhododendron griersonianum TaxID=479676 RepID=A0AAV6JHK7_9ERIC|nr:hypothetical protein RHGRI_019336 [Rhododendron griersonianum]
MLPAPLDDFGELGAAVTTGVVLVVGDGPEEGEPDGDVTAGDGETEGEGDGVAVGVLVVEAGGGDVGAVAGVVGVVVEAGGGDVGVVVEAGGGDVGVVVEAGGGDVGVVGEAAATTVMPSFMPAWQWPSMGHMK